MLAVNRLTSSLSGTGRALPSVLASLALASALPSVCAPALGLPTLPSVSGETVTVTISAVSHGLAEPEGTQTVPANADFGPINATPDVGYGSEAWYVDGSHAGWTVPRIGLRVGDASMVVHVAFQRITDRVTVALAPSQYGTNADSLTVTLPPPWLGQRFHRLRKE